MRGSPLLRSLIAALILLGLGVPLRYLLRAEEAPAAAQVSEPAAAVSAVHLQLSFTAPPDEISVLALGEPVWKAKAPGLEAEQTLNLLWPKEGIDLQFDLAWPAGTRAAARILLTRPDGTEITRYIFSDGPASEVLTFP